MEFFVICNVAKNCHIFSQAILINPHSIKETTQGNLTNMMGRLDKDFIDSSLSGYDQYKFII